MSDPLKSNQELQKEIFILKKKIQELEQTKINHDVTEDNHSISDISSDKRIEHEPTVTLQQLRFHMENTPLGEIEFDKSYRITYWSKQAEKIFGWKANEVLGKQISDLHWVHEDDIQRVSALSAAMIASRRTSNIHTNRNYRKDGSIITCDWYNSALLDEKGELISVHSQVLDITERLKTEQALKESEERLKLAQVSAGAGIWNWDMESGQIKWSRELFILYGLDPEKTEPSLELSNEILHPQDKDIALMHIRQAIQNKDQLDCEYRILLPDNRIRWIKALGSTIYNSTGKPIRMSGICIDITKHKQAEIDLEKSEEHFRTLVNNMQDVVFRANLDGNITFTSPSAAYILGCSSVEEIIGLRIGSDFYLNPNEAQHHVEMLQRYGKLAKQEITLKRRDNGQPVIVSANIQFFYDQEGNILGIEGVYRDITKRKQAEKEREKLILELQQALKEVKTLSGLLPICASCKKIRDDKGYWKQIEAYISEHTEAEFSHGICPDCFKRLYPDVYEEMQKADKR